MGYETDISDKEWAILEPLLAPKQKGRSRLHSLRRIIDAIRYVQRTGCQWRLLPNRFSAVAQRVCDLLALAQRRAVGADHA